MLDALPKKILLHLLAAAAVLAVFSPSALAAGAPTISSVSVDSFKLNTALAHATINPNGGTGTTYKVEYGGTKLYGHSTPSMSLSGTGEIPVVIELVGLHSMSTYHYRVSATNNLGTTVSSEGLFETLITWTVGGKPVTDMQAPVTFADEYKFGYPTEGGYAEFRGATPGGTQVRVYCRQTEPVSGALEVSYSEMVFTNGCFTELNLVKNTNCKPINGIRLHLNAFLAQYEPSVVEMSELCAIGESLSFANGGYSPGGSLEENTKLTTRFEGTSYALGREWEADFRAKTAGSIGGWSLTGAYAGKAFGVS